MKLLKILILIVNLLPIIPAFAFNPSFLRYTPLYYFTKQDWDFSRTTSYQALEHAQDGKKVIWQNPQSGASGYSLPSHTQGSCRHLKIFNQARGMTSAAEYKFCKINSEWKLVE